MSAILIFQLYRLSFDIGLNLHRGSNSLFGRLRRYCGFPRNRWFIFYKTEFSDCFSNGVTIVHK